MQPFLSAKNVFIRIAESSTDRRLGKREIVVNDLTLVPSNLEVDVGSIF